MREDIFKLCLGCGPHPKKGFINMDLREWKDEKGKPADIDVIHNATERPYPFSDQYFEEVHAIEFLEHISFRQTLLVISEVYRILEKGGKFYVQVPDCGKMMEHYVNKLICDCIENKPQTDLQGYANQWCEKCGGRAKVHPTRWLLAFTGAQKHEGDTHLNIFTRERVEACFKDGWKLDFEDDPREWKLKFTATKL